MRSLSKVVLFGILGILTLGALIFYTAQTVNVFTSGQFMIQGPNEQLSAIAVSFWMFLVIIGFMSISLYGFFRVTE